MTPIIDDLRIQSLKPLISPALLTEQLQLTPRAIETITRTRNMATEIIQGRDDRLLVIVGPCSIHDIKAALEYGDRLQPLIARYQQDLCIIMRVYFEKPRTLIGWKGLINDPSLDGGFDINRGLHIARKLLLDLNEKWVPCASEFLDTIIPQFISDLISWGAIGARTTESQIHRELASGLSMPVGFKNGTDGNIQIAIDAIRAARYPHHFLSVTKLGLAAIVSTKGNPSAHVILRGSQNGTNYDKASIAEVCEKLVEAHLPTKIMVDCSHGNSSKDYRKQAAVMKNLMQQLEEGSDQIMGVMLESHLVEGKQNLEDKAALTYGQSITDGCIGWDETEILLADLAEAVKKRRQRGK